MKKIFLLISVCILASVASAQNLTVLHLNDTHSHIDPERGGKTPGQGGVIEQAAYIDSVRCADGKRNVLLVHAGDFSQGTSYFKVFNGDIEVEVANSMQFDALCLGNHEFDNGMDELARRLRNLEVTALCANYDFSKAKSAYVFKTIVDPYIGKYSLIKVNSGVIKSDDVLYNFHKDFEEKITKCIVIRGEIKCQRKNCILRYCVLFRFYVG